MPFDSDLEGARQTSGGAKGDLWLQLLLRLEAQAEIGSCQRDQFHQGTSPSPPGAGHQALKG